MKFNKNLIETLKLTSLALCALLTACGGSDDVVKEVVVEEVPVVVEEVPVVTKPTQGAIYGPHATTNATGDAAAVYAYFDLDTQTTVELSEEEASTNTVWDIAFNRTKVYLNQNSQNAITAYSTGNNSDFFDADNKAIPASFMAATAETELDDYLAITTSDVPSEDTDFVGDVTSNIIAGFYNYDSTTRVISAADTKYFIVGSDDAYTKFRATSITVIGRDIGQITLQTAYQGSSDAAFATEQELVIDASLTCSGDVASVYVDFDTNQEVTTADAWDISFPCTEDATGASFEINIADDAQALQDVDNSYDEIDPNSAGFLDFQANSYSVNAFDNFSHNWYQYALNGGHLLWSQFDTYLVKTPIATYKLQITSYYDAEGTSGNYSFRADEVTELAGVASE